MLLATKDGHGRFSGAPNAIPMTGDLNRPDLGSGISILQVESVGGF